MALTPAILNDFLATLKSPLRAFKSEWESKELANAPRFGSFLLFNPGEVTLTRITAQLLKPDGRHGQGDKLLKAFLSVAAVNSQSDPSQARVTENYRTLALEKDRRQIDLLVSLPDYALAIESKSCGASDQTKQVSDYLHCLEKVSPGGYKLLYLSLHGECPSRESISDEERAKAIQEHHLEVLCYSEFMEKWLTRCIEDSPAVRVRSFLEEFRRYLPIMMADSPEETYMTNPETEKLVADTALSSPENLETSLAVFTNFQSAVWSPIVDSFAAKQKDRLASKGPEWVVELDNGFATLWGGISFWKPRWKGLYFLRIEAAQEGNYKGMEYKDVPLSKKYPRYLDARVAWSDESNHPEVPRLRTELGALNLRHMQKPNLCWYGKFFEPYNDLASLPAMRAMQDGSAVDYVANILLQLSDIAEPLLDQQASTYRGASRK